MNARTALLGLFVVLTLAFASTTVYESGMRTTPTSTSTSTSTSTRTLTSTATSVSTITTTLTQVSTATSTMTTTATSTSIKSVTQVVPADCLGGSVSGYSFGTVDVGTASPATVCLQLYEFNATSTAVLDPASLVTIYGVDPFTDQSIDGISNFTVTASEDPVSLGGRTNASEGIIVALHITPKPGASGTYWFQLQHAWYLGDAQAFQNGPNGVLVAGNGQPDYVPSGQTLRIVLGCGTATFNVQGIGYPLCADILYYRITAVTNSTQ